MSQPADNSVTVTGSAVTPVAPSAVTPAPAVPNVDTAVPALPAKKNRQPRKDGLAPSSATISGVPPLLELAAPLPFHLRLDNRVNTFVPSFIVAAFIIGQMDYQMTHTHRFTQGAPAWLPPMSLAYFGILFILQTLRAQREVSQLPADQLWFLEGFEKMYDLRSLMVAGPLVPIFQALAAHSGPYEWIGDITPALPTVLGRGQNNSHLPANNLFRLLPAIPFYIDQLQRVAALANPIASAIDIFRFHSEIMQQNAAAAANSRYWLYSPGGSNLVSQSVDQLNKARSALAFLPFPPRLSAGGVNTTEMTIAQYCRFYTRTGDVFFNWFPQVSAIMQRYCGFMNDSVPLSAIPPAGTSAGSIKWTLPATNTRLNTPFTFRAAAVGPPAVAAHYEQHPLQSLAATGTHSDPVKEEIEEQTSLVSQVLTLTVNLTSQNVSTANTVSGPFWTYPTVRQTGEVDFANGVSSKIESRYHVDTRRS